MTEDLGGAFVGPIACSQDRKLKSSSPGAACLNKNEREVLLEGGVTPMFNSCMPKAQEEKFAPTALDLSATPSCTTISADRPRRAIPPASKAWPRRSNLAKAKATLLSSRDDLPGTHTAELDLWKAAAIGIDRHKGPWYRSIG